MNRERKTLTRAEADAMLAPGPYVHTYMQAGTNVLIGADVEREKILALADAGRVELAGAQATAMLHGIAASEPGRPWIFCETIPAEEKP